MPYIIILIIFAALLAVVLHLLWSAYRNGVAATPSSADERRAVAQLLAEIDPACNAVDLGSGWGGLAFFLARQSPKRKIEGIEAAWLPWLVSAAGSRLNLSSRRGTGISPAFVRGNYVEVPLKDKTAYICYLSGPSMKALRQRFETDQPKGGCLISIAFAMPGWTPEREIRSSGILGTPVYLYSY